MGHFICKNVYRHFSWGSHLANETGRWRHLGSIGPCVNSFKIPCFSIFPWLGVTDAPFARSERRPSNSRTGLSLIRNLFQVIYNRKKILCSDLMEENHWHTKIYKGSLESKTKKKKAKFWFCNSGFNRKGLLSWINMSLEYGRSGTSEALEVTGPGVHESVLQSPGLCWGCLFWAKKRNQWLQGLGTY